MWRQQGGGGPYTGRMATLSDVAALAGVSISAVSRVLSDAPATRVSAATRERIKSAAVQLDYRPNFAGRALKLSRSNVIALIVPDLTNAVFTELMHGVEDAALERDYMVLLGRAEVMKPGGETIKKLVGEGRVDGMLVQLGDIGTPEEFGAGSGTGSGARAPVIFINSVEDGHIGSVVLEDERAARLATEHLIELGHRRIGLITGDPLAYTAIRRSHGFRKAMHDAGLTVPESYVTMLGYEARRGREAFRLQMSQELPPTALFIANVNAAFGALAEARIIGVRVPEDVSIIAMHETWSAENSWPPLTTVKMPLYELGTRAVQSLWARLHSGTVEDVVVSDPPPCLVLRESTARLLPAGKG